MVKRFHVYLPVLIVIGLTIVSGCVGPGEEKVSPKTTPVATEEGVPAKEYNPGKMIFIAMGPSNQIKVIDPQTNEVVDTFPANKNPHGIGITPDGRYVFTTGTKMGPSEMMMEPGHDDGNQMDMKMKPGSDYIVVTDAFSGEIIKKIDVGGGTHHMAVTPDGSTLLASIPSKSGIAVIDIPSLEMTGLIETGNISDYIAVTRDGKRAYVSNKGDSTVSVVDLASRKEIAEIPVPVRPEHIVVSYEGDFAYVAVEGSDEVAVINTTSNKIISRIGVGDTPHGISITRDDKKVYVSNSEDKSISVINTSTDTVVKEIKLDGEVEHLEVVPAVGKLYASGESLGVVWVIDTSSDTLVDTINTGTEPHQITFPLNLTGYRDITAPELKAMLEKGEEMLLIDVHIPEQQHIKGTDDFIPFNQIEANLDRLPRDKTAKIVVYCRSGSMSAIASKKLVELGYTNVNNLLGGTIEWRKLGYEFEDEG